MSCYQIFLKVIILQSSKKNLTLPAQAATEEGVVVGGGCCLLRLSSKVDAIKEMLDNEDQKVHNLDGSCSVSFSRSNFHFIKLTCQFLHQ